MPSPLIPKLPACCQQTARITRLPTEEGALLHCIWCQGELVFHNGQWQCADKKE